MLKYNIAVSVVFTCIELGSVTDELFVAEEAGGGWGWLLADTVSSYFCCCVGAGAVAGTALGGWNDEGGGDLGAAAEARAATGAGTGAFRDAWRLVMSGMMLLLGTPRPGTLVSPDAHVGLQLSGAQGVMEKKFDL